MKEIKCPECGKAFTIDETQYSDILAQVKNNEFNKELEDRLRKESELIKLQQDKEKNDLLNKLKSKDQEFELEKERMKAQIKEVNDKKIEDLNEELRKLQMINKTLESESELKVKNKTDSLNEKIIKLEAELNLQKAEAEKSLLFEKKRFDDMVKDKDEMIDHYKDLKIKLSTKAIGEELEVYCKNLFESQLRPVLYSSGNNIYFEKDNETVEGTKGDFIYRETTKDNVEVLSIMFEMKNEADDTESKHKNSDFFKKLDSDRKKKNCEYAVLVSLLEADNEQYNNGITTIFEYENMYVIRPNSFTAIINLLRNNALKNVEVKTALVEAKNQNIDITNFENELNDFQVAFSANYERAAKYYEDAIDRIDKTIEGLQKIKDDLTTSGRQLRLANDKAQDISVKKLTKNNETMKKAFEDLKA